MTDLCRQPRLRRIVGVGAVLAAAFCVTFAGAPARAAANFAPDLAAAPKNAGLSAADAERYRKIFEVQERGAWKTADRLIAQIENPMLVGHVLAQRYLHPTHYRATYAELAAWLDRYAALPDAPLIYKLARKRKPAGARYPRRPVEAGESLAAELPLDTVFLYRSAKRLSRSDARKIHIFKWRVRRYVGRTQLSRAERLLERADVQRLFDRFEMDEAHGQVAAGWLYHGKPEKAFDMASGVAERSGADLPTAHWTAGLAAWALDKKAEAAWHFARLALSDGASAWNRAAGAYWAGRVHMSSASTAEAYRWFTVATRFPYTFYGLLAHKRLGLHPEFRFQPVLPSASEIVRLLSTAPGARAAALFEIGRPDLAEAELMSIRGWKKPETTRALLALAHWGELPRLGLEISRRLLSDPQSGWTQHDLAAVMYPVPQWRPPKGFSVDRALIYAFIRQESSFDPRAKSPDGARGLMQLMPRTASWLDRRNTYRGHRRNLLYDPSLNLALAQRYMERLLDNPRVTGDLLRLSVAYNAGPGNLGKWERKMSHDDDPLLFIESLPSLESRLFVERVMTNLWIYRLRLGQATPTLEALAADRWPTYESLDRRSKPQMASEN